jgi:UDP-glucose 4-epimerase
MVYNYFRHKRILITGGNGYIAYNIIKLLKGTELFLTRLDSRIDEWPDISKDSKIRITNVENDVRDRTILESLLPDFDIVFHLAAQTSTYYADSDPANDIGINLLPLVNILDVCEKKSLSPVIIFSGTATEVGMNKRWPVNENFKNKPVTIYDLNKLLAETYLNYYCRKGIVRGATLRLANVYGPGPASSSKDRGIVNMMIRKAIEKLPLTLYGTGEFIRDYIYVDDVAKAFCSAVENIDKINSRYFYIGSGTGHSVLSLFNTIISECYARTGFKPEIKHTEFPDNLSIIEKRQFIANIDKFVEISRWSPETDLTKGIGLTIEYFLKQR